MDLKVAIGRGFTFDSAASPFVLPLDSGFHPQQASSSFRASRLYRYMYRGSTATTLRLLAFSGQASNG